MKRSLKVLKIPCIFLACILSGCIEPYETPATKNPRDFLVVDGFLNTTNSNATIVLKHTVPLDSEEKPTPESGAVVQLKDEGGGFYALLEVEPGRYSLNEMTFDLENEYRIHIKTKEGKVYESLPIILKDTPPIDSVTWNVTDDRVNIHVSTHDDTNQSKYYKWNCIETYKYHSAFGSSVMVQGGQVVSRTNANQIYYCWKTAPIYSTTVASTTQFTKDIVSKKEIISIAAGSLRLMERYSLSVEQLTLTEEAFQYWNEIQKTTEDLGTLFDPLPGQVIGNISCTSDPSEPVIGFISGGSVSTTRIYIDKDDLSDDIVRRDFNCSLDTIAPASAVSADANTLVSPVYEGLTIVGYLASGVSCVDCRVLGGGVTVPPDFWIE